MNLFLFFFHGQFCNPIFSQIHDPISSFSFILLFIICIALSLSFTLHGRPSKTPPGYPQPGLTRNPETRDPNTLPPVADRPAEGDPTRTLSVEALGSVSAKWTTFVDGQGCEGYDPNPVSESGSDGRKKKKKKRKAKKKEMNSGAEEDDALEKSDAEENSASGTRPESAYVYPFTSSSSAMQRKIKQQYDELVKRNDSKKLTLSQVVQFANSLVDARSELQHKADAIQRKFVITKALLCKADRSSFDRIRQQIYKLELEQKRLEEDASVYNWLQQQLKLSPAYKKILEIGVSMEKEKSCKLGERRDDEFFDISFEEFLAQEKKDSFWQKNGKSRQCSS